MAATIPFAPNLGGVPPNIQRELADLRTNDGVNLSKIEALDAKVSAAIADLQARVAKLEQA